MRKVGIVLLVFAIGNLLVAIIASANGETYAAGSKFSSSLLLGAIGGLLCYFGGKKDTSNQENINRSSPQESSIVQESPWQKYKRLNPTKASAIEAITKRKMSSQSERDVQEIVLSMERWAKSIGCQIQDIKTEFLKSYQSTFDNADTKEILEHLRNVKLKEEANRFNISTQNTCTHFMIKWLTESLQKEAAPSANHIKYRNKTSARDLIITENSELQFVENPKTGKIFFICGRKKGYVSPAAVEKMKTGSLDDFYYVEASVGGSDYVPCLCYAKSKNVIKQFSVDDATTHNTSNIEKKIRTKLRNAFHELIEDTQKEEAYNKMEMPFKYLTLKAAIANFYQQMKNDKSLAAMANLYRIDHNTLLDEECLKIMEEVEIELLNNTESKEEIGNKPDDDLPF
ncbi:MAG: hypothetical protein IJ722_07060 [Alloprevotella sp.]|nr:hypothetical protein [Alloprevotella sp.]